MSRLFRQAMQKLSFPTMIVTSPVDKDAAVSVFRGLTISSMTSLSVMPKPLIQFNLKVPSNTSTNIHKYKYFAIHFLKANPLGIELARTFSQGITLKHTKPFENMKLDTDYTIHRGKVSDLNGKGDSKLPVLNNVEQVLICKALDVILVQDHEIWIGEVVKIISNIKDGKDMNGGLLHCNRQFFKLGDKV